jgi:hypothetical protein
VVVQVVVAEPEEMVLLMVEVEEALVVLLDNLLLYNI